MEFSFQGGTQLLPPIMLQLLKVEWLLLNYCHKSYKSKKKQKWAKIGNKFYDRLIHKINLTQFFLF